MGEYKHMGNQTEAVKQGEVKGTLIAKETSSDVGEPYYPVPNKENQELYEKYRKLAAKAAARGLRTRRWPKVIEQETAMVLGRGVQASAGLAEHSKVCDGVPAQAIAGRACMNSYRVATTLHDVTALLGV